MSPHRLVRAVALAALVALAAGAAGLMAWRAHKGAAAEASSVGGPFRLTDQTGRGVDQRLLLGKWTAVFFGYTYCPDVCPTTLANLGQASSLLGEAGRRFQVVFITVDPERDTPAQLAAYLSSPAFPKGTIGLTGTPDEIARVAKAYHVFYQKAPQGSSYTVDHTAVVYLMDPDGRFSKPLNISAPPPALAAQIRAAVAAG